MEVLARYKRKAVPNPLEIRGISQNAVDSLIRTSPDELPALAVLPKDFTDHVEEAISSYSPEPVSNVRLRAALHTQPSVVPEETHSLSLSDTWTTGVGGGSATERLTDDRSSTCSTMSYDDFDYEASVKVRRMFEEIDATLFENVDADVSSDGSGGGGGSGESVSDHLHAECRQWNAVFPHLRILGKQLIDAKDPGYQSVSLQPSLSSDLSLPSSGGSTGSHLEDVTEQDLHDAQSLSIDGRRVVPRTLDKCCPPGLSLDTVRHLEEEIFEQDGCYEEMIAVDREALDDAMDSRSLHAVHRRRRSRYPPVTPNACVKDDVSHAVFDVIWANINVAMRVLLQQYVDSRTSTQQQHRGRHGADNGGAGTRRTKPSGGASVNDTAFRFPQIVSQPPSRADFAHSSSRPLGSLFAASGTAAARHPHLANGSLNAAPNAGSHSTAAAAAAAAVTAAATAETIKLDNILTISKKEMQTREKTFSEEPSNAGTPTASMSWPGGSLLKKTTASVLVNALHRNMSATTKKLPAGRGRLAPLNDRVRTPTVEDEAPIALRPGAAHVGYQGLHMAGKRISSPPTVATSSGMRMLPPIVHSEQFDQLAAAASLSQRVASQQKRSSRATSAVADKEGRAPRDKVANVPLPETRPSTTHTAAFLVDASTIGTLPAAGSRQVTTPLGVTSHFRGEGAGLFLGITGNGLNHGTGSAVRDVHGMGTAGDSGLLSPLGLADQLRQRTTVYDDPDLDDDDVDDEHYDDFSRQHYHPPGHQHWGTSHATTGYSATGYRHRGGKPVSSLAR